jgi:hypothetical protein
MSIKKFEDGSTLFTGADVERCFLGSGRDNFSRRDCRFCIHKAKGEECDGCSNPSDASCSCHLNPPCSFCVDNHFEATPWIINFHSYANGPKWKWECFPSTEKIFKKYQELEAHGIVLDAEILTTQELSITLTHLPSEALLEIAVCNKPDFVRQAESLINLCDWHDIPQP